LAYHLNTFGSIKKPKYVGGLSTCIPMPASGGRSILFVTIPGFRKIIEPSFKDGKAILI